MEPQPSRPDRSHGIPSPEGERTGVADLERGIAESESGGRPRRHRCRSVLSAVTLFLAALPSVLSAVAVWADSVVEGTDGLRRARVLDDPGAEGGFGRWYGERETRPS
ncbi:hypothetical protein [Streptomyces kurssanovii]|uniref:Uncharacterized protein n=1 Tax=Streptomyces kurssanovii TaxID=67312 RepID=A0ABV3HPR3_9ACTN